MPGQCEKVIINLPVALKGHDDHYKYGHKGKEHNEHHNDLYNCLEPKFP